MCAAKPCRNSSVLVLMMSCSSTQTTNLLLQAGEEALASSPDAIAGLAPLRYCCALHEPLNSCLGCEHKESPGFAF